MKILALDLGDVHTGVAISDAMGITCQPLTTISTFRLEEELGKILSQEQVKDIVVGYPRTLRGTESKQTEKILQQFEELKIAFPQYSWKLCDERLTSKHAGSIQRSNKKSKKPKDKLKIHAVAAALILQTYLESLRF
ncbi:MAG TPA: Holliday junction resolvase RuvX [Candidatus Babeliales bacterium]|nr:Holliday junction resolvase RuvX [Candidatus Babeliales bacterium]